MKLSLSRNQLAYTTTALGQTLMGGILTFYYVDIYLNRFHVSESWFQFSQLMYLIWNTVNDPLVGYFQDNFSFSWIRSRRHSILYGAPFFSLAFLLTWIPWGDYSEPTWLAGFQLMFSLCFYDTLYTFVILAHCALFAEISDNHEDRLELIRLSKIASVIGSSSLVFTNLLSDNSNNYVMFVASCALFALLAFFCFLFTGSYAETSFDTKKKEMDKQDFDKKHQDVTENQNGIWTLVWQIYTQPSFIAFVLMNFCQVYHTAFLANFMGIFCDSLISHDVLPSTARSVFYGATEMLPQIMLIWGTALVGKVGYYNVLLYSFYLKIIMGTLLYISGPIPACLILYFLVERTEAIGIFGLFNICLSDLIDLDFKTFNRKHPLSSMICGLNALITKPAISVAPMLTVAVLNRYGYQEMKDLVDSKSTDNYADSDIVFNMMFLTACVTPIVIGALQIVVWRKYAIRNTHLSLRKSN